MNLSMDAHREAFAAPKLPGSLALPVRPGQLLRTDFAESRSGGHMDHSPGV
jgi:hypothetical protein